MGESEEYWKGYDDHRVGVYNSDGYLHHSDEEEDYERGHSDSADDQQNGHDAR